MEIYRPYFQSSDLRRTVVTQLLMLPHGAQANCPDCGYLISTHSYFASEGVVDTAKVRCLNCTKEVVVDLRGAVDNVLFHALVRQRQYRSAGESLLSLSERLRRVDPESSGDSAAADQRPSRSDG